MLPPNAEETIRLSTPKKEPNARRANSTDLAESRQGVFHEEQEPKH